MALMSDKGGQDGSIDQFQHQRELAPQAGATIGRRGWVDCHELAVFARPKGKNARRSQAEHR